MTGANLTGSIPPGANLTTEGIPPLPLDLVDAVGPYAEFRAATFEDWHPTRREILIGTRFADTQQIHHVRMPGGARIQRTFFPDNVTGASFQPTHGEYFLFSKDIGGNEFAQIYRADLADGRITLLTDGTSQNLGYVWSRQGDRIAYTTTRRNGRDRDVHILDPLDRTSDRTVAVLTGSWSVADWSPEDTRLILCEYRSINESYLRILDLATGALTPLTPLTPQTGEEPVAYGQTRFAPDGRSVYTVTDRAGEFRHLARIDPETGECRYLTADIPWDVETFDLSPDGRTVVFSVNENGVSVLRVRDTETGEERVRPSLPDGVIGPLKFRSDGTEVAFALASAGSPSDVHTCDIASGAVTRWTFGETGGLPSSAFSRPALIEWRAPDGLTITGFLYRPDATKFPGKRPIIVLIHGGPESQARPGFLGRWNYFLSELGVALVLPNVRGSSGYGKSFLKADNGMRREAAYTDIEALFDRIASLPDLDGDRIMVTGGSYGGHMTLALATRYPERIACSLSVVGISHFVTFLENTEAYRRDLRRAEYGDERDPEMRAYFERTAPLNRAGRITHPLFLVQGRNDPRVPYTEALQMKAAVADNGVPVWFLMADDEGHGFVKKRNLDFQLYATIAFVREFLLTDGRDGVPS